MAATQPNQVNCSPPTISMDLKIAARSSGFFIWRKEVWIDFVYYVRGGDGRVMLTKQCILLKARQLPSLDFKYIQVRNLIVTIQRPGNISQPLMKFEQVLISQNKYKLL